MSRRKGFFYRWLTREAVSPDHADYLYGLRKRAISIKFFQILIIVLLFTTWELLSHFGVINTFLVSQPSKILSLLVKMTQNGQLLNHIGVTVTENIIGFISGTLLGTLIAIILWWFEYLYDLLEPYIVILNSIPKVALGPVIIVWMGNGPQAIIVMALLISVIVTIMMMINGFREVEGNLVKLLSTLGASKKQVLFKVILPASIPTIFSALKVSVGLSMVGTIVGEFLVSKAGLGYLIVYGGQVFNLHLVMMSIILLCLIAGLMYYIIVKLEQLVIKWR
ncbi:ABC transporter permease [Halothermothrix orenii]|uniref:Binding-protein-dependent transport systems inner membrane component n=1 Tax=Halothermothrix orenii (strain H 168 / OCM 544 / DSM 9562) TaxID=373903 RepID=B8CX82_HALOH|nr:ABC transporter permease [Halothermothrix orenii]ACL69901.1 binding-protein-dependent transport systems inner membrane component [Halothermothrix orenii H 168]